MNWTYVQYAALIAVAVLLFWLPTRIEVHWAARDGTRCICRGQLRDDTGMAQTPWREYRVQVAPERRRRGLSAVVVRRPAWWLVAGGRACRRRPAPQGRVLAPPATRDDAGRARWPCVCPRGSRAVAVLDELAQRAEMDR